MDEWRYVLAYNRNISIIINFKQYFHSFIQFVMFRGRVTRQTNRLHVLRMTVKLASVFLNCLSTNHIFLPYMLFVLKSKID